MDDQVTWPPPPWHLRGQARLTLWTVPRAVVSPLPVRPVVVAGRAFVVTAFVDYQPPGVLAYREFAAAVVVRRGLRVGVSITHIRVDSEQSRRGARAMWAIPKQPAEFAGAELAGAESTDNACLAPDGTLIARAAENPLGRPRLPVFAAASTWQSAAGALVRTPLRATARIGRTRLRWEFAPPLDWLHTAEPRLDLAVASFRLRFGAPGEYRVTSPTEPPAGP